MAMVYCRACGKEIHETAPMCPHCGAPQNQSATTSSIKSQTVAGLWCAFLGGFGAHRFYLGRIVTGVLSILFFWTYIPALIAYVDLFIIAFSSSESWATKHNGGKKSAPVHWTVKVLALVIPVIITFTFFAAIIVPALASYRARNPRPEVIQEAPISGNYKGTQDGQVTLQIGPVGPDERSPADLSTANGSVCVGSVQGVVTGSGAVRTFTANEGASSCVATLTVKGNQIVVAEGEQCAQFHGMQCTFNGTLTR